MIMKSIWKSNRLPVFLWGTVVGQLIAWGICIV